MEGIFTTESTNITEFRIFLRDLRALRGKNLHLQRVEIQRFVCHVSGYVFKAEKRNTRASQPKNYKPFEYFSLVTIPTPPPSLRN